MLPGSFGGLARVRTPWLKDRISYDKLRLWRRNDNRTVSPSLQPQFQLKPRLRSKLLMLLLLTQYSKHSECSSAAAVVVSDTRV